MAARLEAAAKQYNVEILISGFLNSITSRKMRSNLRHIDTVTVKGSNVPVEFYTIDLDQVNLEKKITDAEVNSINFDQMSKGQVKRYEF